jgi:hypothetical protein
MQSLFALLALTLTLTMQLCIATTEANSSIYNTTRCEPSDPRNRCQKAIIDSVKAFVSDETLYSHQVIPTVNLPIPVTVDVTLARIVNINQVDSAITTMLFIETIWKDDAVTWDPSQTNNISDISMDADLFWKPDIQVDNYVPNTIHDGEKHAEPLWIMSDGTMVYTPSVVTTTSCAFDLTLFPFDTQYCYLEVGSYWFDNVELKLNKLPGEAIVLDTFGHLEWTINYVSAEEYVWDFEEAGGIYSYDYVDWEISMTRNSNFYIINGVLPTLFVTVITLVSLWLPDMNSRLQVCITALLSVFAVQWTMSASLPVTKDITWLEVFSVTCVTTMSFICLECCIIGQMTTLTKEPPVWIQFLTYHAVLKGITEATVIDKAMALKRLNRIRGKNKEKVHTMVADTDLTKRHQQQYEEGLEAHRAIENDTVTQFEAPDHPVVETKNTPPHGAGNRAMTPPPHGLESPLTSDPMVRHRRWSTLRKVAQPRYDNDKKSSVKEYEAQNQRTWVLFAVAIDDILKVLLPTYFAIFLVIHVLTLF